MTRYKRGRLVGIGSHSSCFRATQLSTGRIVALKVCSNRSFLTASTPGAMSFHQQVAVLQEILKPFSDEAAQKLWGDVFPEDHFVPMLEHSQGLDGRPGPDFYDGALCVVMEYGQRSLRSYLEKKRREGCALAAAVVQSIACSVLRCVAALHSKGFAHMDLKPDNFLFCAGKLKLIDFDGCLALGSDACSMSNRTYVSFSTPYAAPEWLELMERLDAIRTPRGPPTCPPTCAGPKRGPEPPLSFIITAELDSWSAGLTLCELVTLKPVVPHKIVGENGEQTWFGIGVVDGEVDEAALKTPRSVATPLSIKEFSPALYSMLHTDLVATPRKTPLECLSNEYFRGVVTDPHADEWLEHSQSFASLAS